MEQDEGVAAIAGDEHANDEYGVDSALAGPPVPPEVFPDELAKQQSREQGGEDERTADATADAEKVSVDQANKEQLEAAVSAYKLDVKGTGSNGGVTAEDLRKTLKGAGYTEIEE